MRHTRLGKTLYGAMNLPLVTLTMARYAGIRLGQQCVIVVRGSAPL